MITNKNMRQLLAHQPQPAVPQRLPQDLQSDIRKGWNRWPDGTVILGSPAPRDKASYHRVVTDEDIMAMEIDRNDIHIEDEDLVKDETTYIDKVVSRGLYFIARALEEAARAEDLQRMTAVISTGIDEDFLMHGTNTRFFVQRGDLPDRYRELEGYKIEAIAVIQIPDIHRITPSQ